MGQIANQMALELFIKIKDNLKKKQKKRNQIKTIIILAVGIIIALSASYFIGTGFQKASGEVLVDYTVSEDGKEMTFCVGSVESMGYIRGFKDKGGGVKPHYLTFYRTFGGINSSWGAKNTFTLKLAPEDTEIYFNRPGGGYELVLIKDEETGEWNRTEGEK